MFFKVASPFSLLCPSPKANGQSEELIDIECSILIQYEVIGTDKN